MGNYETSTRQIRSVEIAQFDRSSNISLHLDTCRIKPVMKNIIPFCYGGYSGSNEETRPFYPGWSMNETQENVSSSVNKSFIYQTSEQLDSYFYIGQHGTYRSGGYVYEFRDSLEHLRNDMAELHRLGWIDRQTRAILIQMNLYNPNIPLFTSVALIVEILPSSGVYPSARIEPLDFNGKYRIHSSLILLHWMF